MNISNWPLLERPKEKLISFGADKLSDAELIACVLQSGIKGLDVMELARLLLVEFDGLRGVLGASRDEICGVKGLGESKYARLAVIVELGNRCRLESLKKREVLNGARHTKEYLKAKYQACVTHTHT